MSPPSRPGDRPSCQPPRLPERGDQAIALFLSLSDLEKRVGRVRPVRLAAHQRHLALAGHPEHRDGDQSPAGNFGDRAASGQQRHAELEFHGALDAVEAGQRDHHPQRDVAIFEQPQHRARARATGRCGR